MRKPNETIMQFAQALKRLALKAFPNMSTDAQEQWVLDQFTLGLINVELRRHVQFGHPHDLNEAISYAIEFEAFESGNKDKLKKPANREAEVCALSGPKPSKNESGQDQNKGTQPSDDAPQASGGKDTGEKKSWDKSKIECRYCKKMGHMVRECRKLKWKNEQEAKRNEASSETPKDNPGN
jgi:hypothetical protein